MSVFVRRAVASAVLSMAVACGSVPKHSGYKSDKAQPWKKPKVLKLSDKLRADTDDELSYAGFERARWFAVDLPSSGDLIVTLEASPIAPSDDDDFDLALEVLDPTDNVIVTADLDAEDAHELTKERTLLELVPGRYLIHVYLQRRTDRAEFELDLKFEPGGSSGGMATGDIAFPPRLAMVPLDDDTPAGSRPKPKPDKPTKPDKPRPDKPDKPDKPAPPPTPTTGGPVSARVINVAVASGGTQITINRGTDNGLAAGMSGSVTGIKSGSFTLSSCSARSCKAVVKATPDEVNKSGKAVVNP